MYTPTHFAQTDTATLVAFMRRFSFATIVSQVAERPFATHLPFVVEHLKMAGNTAGAFCQGKPAMAKPGSTNGARHFQRTTCLYFTVAYEKELNVPT